MLKTALCCILLSLLSIGLIDDEINTDELLEQIQTQWQSVSDYCCVIETYTEKGETKQTSTIEQKFLKPKWIRMQVLDGDGKGSIGIYDPFTKKVHGCKTGILNFIVLTLDLSDSRVSSIRGHRIDQGDCLTLIGRLQTYHANGEFTSVERTTYSGKPAYLFKAEVQDSSRLWGARKEHIWLAEENLFPLRDEQRLGDETIVHYSRYRDVEINTGLTKKDFEL
jgi:outer membrane lipoprotein-sorting protein